MLYLTTSTCPEEQERDNVMDGHIILSSYPRRSISRGDKRKKISYAEWHFAKTRPQIPHWYCLLKECEDKDEFLWFARYIWEHSIPGEFFGHTYKYFYLGMYKYWIMDLSPEECDLINRDEVK